MGFWGKILGGAAGLLIGGPIGGLIGALAGHAVDRQYAVTVGEAPQDATQSVAFTIGVIALSAKMAKVDGTVTGAEVAAFRRLFRFDPEDMEQVGYVFDLARRDPAGYEAYARQVAVLFGDRHPVLEELLECLFLLGEADGELHDEEIRYLYDVARIFGFSDAEFRTLLAAHRAAAGEEDDPYIVLGVTPDMKTEEIRGVYRRLAREHHPDRLIAAGMPKEFIDQATSKMAAINAAYDRIVKDRATA